MILRCKIYPKYLDEILEDCKSIEYREIEGIEFNDGNRKVLIRVKSIDTNIDKEYLEKKFPDVKWGDNLKVRIFLGEVIK